MKAGYCWIRSYGYEENGLNEFTELAATDGKELSSAVEEIPAAIAALLVRYEDVCEEAR